MTAGPRERAVREGRVLLFVAAAIVVVSGIAPRDRPTWWMEVAPAIAGIVVLSAIVGRFPFTPLLQRLLLLHALILCVGGHWTYAEVPFGNWLKDVLHLARNPYDRIGHLAQGFVPSLLTREVLVRRNVVRRGAWLFGLTVAVALAISAAYELVEWLAAELLGQGADAFLGSQGDPWDTQWDMFCALIGSLSALLLLSRLHDRGIARIERDPPLLAAGEAAQAAGVPPRNEPPDRAGTP